MILPYIVYGDVKLNGTLQPDETVTATNNTKGGTTNEVTDASGHYEIDISNLSNGYAVGDSITISWSAASRTFDIDSGFEYNQDLALYTHVVDLTLVHTASVTAIIAVPVAATITHTVTKSIEIQMHVTETISYAASSILLVGIVSVTAIEHSIAKSFFYGRLITASLHHLAQKIAGDPPACSMSLDEDWIVDGEEAILTWSSTNVHSVIVDHGVGSVEANGNVAVSPTLPTIFRGTFAGDGGICYCNCTLVVHPQPPVGTVNIYMLWEGAVAPDGWEIDTSHDDRLLRADASTYEDGSGDQTHTIPVAAGCPSYELNWYHAFNPAAVRPNHTHPAGTTPPPTEPFPPYRSARLIKSRVLCGVLPAGIISFAKTVPSGWVTANDYNSKFILLKNQTPADGGSAMHSHSLESVYTGLCDGAPAGNHSEHYPHPDVHRHRIIGTIDPVSLAEPSWYGMGIVRATSNQTTSKGLIAMFDAIPHLLSGWKVISISERYIKQAAYGNIGGSADRPHNHPHSLSTEAANDSAYRRAVSNRTEPACDNFSHTHEVALDEGGGGQPPYAQFVFCEFIGAKALLQPIHGTKTYSILRPDDDLAVGDKVRVYQTSSGPVAIKESWSVGDKITL